MKRETLLARMLRAFSGLTQEQLAAELGVTQPLVAQIEGGESTPTREQLRGMARCAGIALRDAEELVREYEALRRPFRRPGRSAEDLLDGMASELRSRARAAYRRLLTLPIPESLPRAEDRLRAGDLFSRLERLDPPIRRGLVRLAEPYQTWALCEQACHASERAASRDLEEAAAWARLAQEIAGRMRGPEAWRRRLRGYAAAHAANVVRVRGDLDAAAAAFEEAKRLWESGADPAGVLDRGRMLDLEASLRRAERRFGEALALLDEAVAVGRSPERAWIKRGFTLEVMGDYEGAVEALLRAAPRLDRQAEPLLWYNQRFNLAAAFVQLGRSAEAAELVPEIRGLAAELGDRIFLLRLTWLEGRIASGLGRRAEALARLAEARRGFEELKMSYDVALALLEEAVLLLEEGRAAEVQTLAHDLTKVFAENGVHREALAALRLFHEAAQREEATAEMARRVLRFLFRARHDPELRFETVNR
jgi:transcriptional regulator with XRE-family HTH domain